MILAHIGKLSTLRESLLNFILLAALPDSVSWRALGFDGELRCNVFKP